MTQKQPRFLSQGTGAVWRELLLCQKNRAHFAALESMMDTQPQKTANETSWQAAVQRFSNTQSTPRVVIPPLVSHTRKDPERRAYKPQFRQKRKRSRSPAGPRRLGTATRISASLSRRLSAFFESTPSQDPKAAKYAVLIPGPGMFVNVRNAPRVVIAPPSETPPVSACKLLCAIFLREPSVCPLSHMKANVGRLCRRR